MPRLLTGSRVFFALLTVFALVGGYVGLAQLSPDGDQLDTFYGTLQLFVLGNQIFDQAPTLPWTLQAARFAAPAVTGYAVFETGRLIAAEQARRLRARTIAGHTVVAGATAFAEAVQARLEKRGVEVTRIIGPVTSTALREAGVSRASALITCADHRQDPWVNLVSALEAAQVARVGKPLTVHIEIGDATAAFTARSLGMTQAGQVKVRFFNMDELAAAALAKAEGVHQDIAIAGLQEFGTALLVELARAWRRQARTEPLNVTVVDDQATAAIDRLVQRHPVVSSVCKLTPLDGAAIPSGQSFSRVYVCYQDEAKALRTALNTAGLWPSETGGLVVRLDRLAGISEAFGSTGRLLDDMQGRLRITSAVELASAAMAERDDSDERLARAIHERYLVSQLARGVQMGAAPAMIVWEELSESMRDANRAQAAGIRDKLDRINCNIAVYDPARPEFAYRSDEIEMLAEMEHQRWMDDKLAAGWKYGKPRNDAAKLHDCLVPWPDLSDTERDKDRDAVRNIPELLAEVGLQPVRLATRP